MDKMNKDFILWRETSKERIEKYTQAGIMFRGSRYKETSS